MKLERLREHLRTKGKSDRAPEVKDPRAGLAHCRICEKRYRNSANIPWCSECYKNVGECCKSYCQVMTDTRCSECGSHICDEHLLKGPLCSLCHLVESFGK